MKYYQAQLNIARMLAPIDDPVMLEFYENLDRINALAESAKGFVWRLKDDNNNATSIKVYEDDLIIVNMSVWETAEDLMNFVYQTDHREYIKRRSEWFSKMGEMHMVLWYVPEDRVPTIQEAAARLAYLQQHGPTPFAFSFAKRFLPEESSQYFPIVS